MAVPAKASLHVEATHVSPAGDHVFDGSSQYVTIVGQASCEGRSIIERVPANSHSLTNDKTNSLRVKQNNIVIVDIIIYEKIYVQ